MPAPSPTSPTAKLTALTSLLGSAGNLPNMASMYAPPIPDSLRQKKQALALKIQELSLDHVETALDTLVFLTRSPKPEVARRAAVTILQLAQLDKSPNLIPVQKPLDPNNPLAPMLFPPPKPTTTSTPTKPRETIPASPSATSSTPPLSPTSTDRFIGELNKIPPATLTSSAPPAPAQTPPPQPSEDSEPSPFAPLPPDAHITHLMRDARTLLNSPAALRRWSASLKLLLLLSLLTTLALHAAPAKSATPLVAAARPAIMSPMNTHTLLAAYLHHFPAEHARTRALDSFLHTTKASLTDRSNMDGHLTGSAFILSPDNASTLLIFHKRLQRWLQPGGHIDQDESPLQAAAREAHEELGLPLTTPSPLLLHPWHTASPLPIDIDSHPIPANPKKNELAHTHHDLLYLFILDPQTPLSPQLTEVNAAQWFPISSLKDSHPDSRFSLMSDRLRTTLT